MSEPQPAQPQQPTQPQCHPAPQPPMQQQPTPQQAAPQQPVKRMKRVSVPVAGLVVMAVFDVLGGFFLLGLLVNILGSASTASSVDFVQVMNECDSDDDSYVSITADSDSLDIDVESDGTSDESASEKVFDCVCDKLDMPSSVSNKINGTRLIDGKQSDTWDGIKATWSYSPSDDSQWGGELDVTFEHAK